MFVNGEVDTLILGSSADPQFASSTQQKEVSGLGQRAEELEERHVDQLAKHCQNPGYPLTHLDAVQHGDLTTVLEVPVQPAKKPLLTRLPSFTLGGGFPPQLPDSERLLPRHSPYFD